MTRAKVRSVCPHRFLMVTGIDHRLSVGMSRCYQCGTPVTGPLTIPLSTWFLFPRKKLHLIPRPAHPWARCICSETMVESEFG
jgi:hypothetical protein